MRSGGNNFNQQHTTHAVGSRRWADLCISRVTWRRTQYSAVPAWPDPTAVPRTRSSRPETWRSRWQTDAASYSISDRWELAAFSGRRAASEQITDGTASQS